MLSLNVLKIPGWRGIFLGLACALASWFLAQTSLFLLLEEWFQDGAFSFRGKRPTRARVVIVGLDDPSLDQLKKPLLFICPELAEVVAFVKKEGALAIGLDFLIAENLMDLKELEAGGSGDATKLGQAILDAKNVVLPEWQLENRWLRPIPQLQLKHLLNPAPTDLGFVNFTEDDDHFLRRQQLYVRAKIEKGADDARMHFALALFSLAYRAKISWDEEHKSLLLGDEPVPLDENQKLPINFVGPPGTIPVVPMGDVLKAAREGKASPYDFHGTIVIVGATARSQQDYHATPFSNNYWRTLHYDAGLMSGSEIHANILATLADRAYIRTLPWPVALAVLLLMGAALGRAFSHLNLAWGFLLAFAHHWAWKGLALASFAQFHLRLPIADMLLLGFLSYGLTFCLRWWTLRRMLGVVKSESVARMLEDDPGRLDLRGEERIVTVLFADIRSFTDFSEKHSAHEVVKLLNTYFAAVVPMVEKYGGTLNQYMGDGIMVLFNAPASQPDHALRAVQTAVAMVRRVHEMQPTWTQLDFPTFKIGVGIHTGRIVAGTVGSPSRLDYTAIGDTVNTAARIEAQNKDFASEILISSETYKDLPAHDRRQLGCAEESRPAKVKGKEQTLLLHEVKIGEG